LEGGVMGLTGDLISGGIAAGSVIAGLIVYQILDVIFGWLQTHRPPKAFGMPVNLKHWRGPFRALVPALALAIALSFLTFPATISGALAHALTLWIIGALAWLLTQSLSILRDMIMSRHPMGVPDNLQARRVYTQLRVIQRILTVIIVILAIAIMLMTFDRIRQVGVSILASAGIVGIVFGLAAQQTLGSLLAGIQIAITQPIRQDDVVVVEGDWGTIEEINLTYVVVKIWDQRRLVLPVTYFIQTPFENWTRTSAALLGTVFIYCDYTVPVAEVRDEFKRIIDETSMWDKKAWTLQVTDATDRTIELRALLSASDSSTLWNLRCHVREKLSAFLQARYPDALPRVRLEMEREHRDWLASPSE
jgi:small-conductance mechanosensitive channel